MDHVCVFEKEVFTVHDHDVFKGRFGLFFVYALKVKANAEIVFLIRLWIVVWPLISSGQQRIGYVFLGRS